MEEATTARRVDAEAKKVEEEKKKADDAAAELAAQTDIESLLKGGDDEAPVAPQANKLNDLDNTQLMDVVGTAVETCIDAKLKQSQEQTAKQFEGMTDTMKKVCQLLGQMQTQSALKGVRDKYPDFDTFKDDTLAVLKKYPMMEIEDAYLLAKQARKGDLPEPAEIESERPTVTPFGAFSRPAEAEAAPSGAEVKPVVASPGVSGIVSFRQIVGKAVNKLDIGKGR